MREIIFAAVLMGSLIAGSRADEWRILTPGPSPSPRYGHTFVKMDNDVYIYGGRNASGAVMGDLWKWQPGNVETAPEDMQKWTEVPADNPPTPRAGYAAIASGNRMYVTGGVNAAGEPLADLWSFDPTTTTWSQLVPGGDAPPALRDPGMAALVDGRIALFGGVDASGMANPYMYIYSPGTNLWERKTRLNGPPRGSMGMVSAETKVYVFGGSVPVPATDGKPEANTLFFDDLWIYDILDDSWRTVPKSDPWPAARGGTTMVACGPAFYLFGGTAADGTPLADCWRLDPFTSTWARCTDMPVALTDAAAAREPADDFQMIVMFGGLDASAPSAQTFRYYPENAPTTHAISGTVTGAVQANVAVALAGTVTTVTTTRADGTYTFRDLADGSYTVTPTLAGYTFTPDVRQVDLAGSDHHGNDFTATAVAVVRTPIHAGYSAIGLPLRGSNLTSAADILARIAGATAVYAFAVESRDWEVYSGGDSGNFPLAPGMAVFVASGQGGELVTEGEWAMDIHRSLATGYNLLCVPKSQEGLDSASQLLAAIPDAMAVWAWHGAGQHWLAWTGAYGGSDFAITPGTPFLVAVSKDCTWPAE